MQRPNSLFSFKCLSTDPNGRFVIAKIKLGDEDSLLSFMDELGLVDVYRVLHPKKKAFTYESKTLRLKSRIDFFLIAQSLKLNIRTAEIRSSIAPDHKAIYLSTEINDEFHRGPRTWKFNNQLLEDENYVQLITECLPRILAKYQEVESHQLLWELIKMEIRAETSITYSKAERRELKNREIHLQEKLDALDNEICHGHDHFNQSLLDEYESIKTELKDIYEQKGKEAMLRSKARWIEKGEKPTNYFFNLEKRNFEKKVIAQLKLENGEIISDMKQVNLEIESFYSDLLETKSAGLLSTNFRENFSAFVENLDIPKLSFEESMSLESDVTLGEIKNVLKSFQSNKSPGGDGFSKEFFETFFDLIGTHLLNSYNEAFTKGQLSISQRRGVICLIPKDDSDLTELSNWRPLTLLNVDYKILAKAIGQRIESKLSSLIHSDQTGFIKGRFIGQNVRLLNDIMEYTEAKNLPGILLFIDFRKAFDTIEWNFLHKCIELYNFGPNIRKWISILYNNVESDVMNAGFMTNYFKVSRGVRQGCPLSPLLFVLAVEMLALKIRQDQLCRGIELPNGQNAKISQFADDTTLILEDTTSLI